MSGQCGIGELTRTTSAFPLLASAKKIRAIDAEKTNTLFMSNSSFIIAYNTIVAAVKGLLHISLVDELR
jgi:hypothetical protein